jgi:hypothetical protein
MASAAGGGDVLLLRLLISPSTLFELSFCYAAAQIFPRKKPRLPVYRLRIL